MCEKYSRAPLVVAFDQKSWLARPRCRHTASAFSHCNPPYVVAKRVCPLVCLNNSFFATLQNQKKGTAPAETRPDLLIRKVCLAQVSKIASAQQCAHMFSRQLSQNQLKMHKHLTLENIFVIEIPNENQYCCSMLCWF